MRVYQILFSVLLAAAAANAGSLTTTFASTSSLNGNMFDVVVGGQNLTVTGFDLNFDDVSATEAVSVAIYTRPGSWVGFEDSSDGWTLAGTVTGIHSAGNDVPTHISVPQFVLPASGTMALYLTAIGDEDGPYLAYARATTAVGTVAASNADLSILIGSGNGYPFGEIFSPRIWNGTIYYSSGTGTATPEPSTLALAGTGLALALGWLRRRRQA